MSDIAAEAQVGVQTIYRWWPSRSALLADVLAETARTAMPFTQTGHFRTDLRKQMRAMVRAFNGETGGLLREVLADAQTDPATRQAFIESFYQHRRDQAHAFLQHAIDNGQLDEPADLDGLMLALYAPLWLTLLVRHQPLDNRLVDRTITAVLGPTDTVR